jgi:hypothetical protein
LNVLSNIISFGGDGEVKPRTYNISKFFSNLERLLRPKNIFDEG